MMHRDGRRRRPLVGTALVGLILVLPVGSGQAQEATAPGRWTGCWNVGWGEWSPPLREQDTLRYRPPPRVELTEALAGRPMEGGFHVQPAPGSLPTPHSAGFWQPRGPDSVRVVWSDGTMGTVGRFGGQGDTLVGGLRSFVDIQGRPIHRAEAYLVRVSCSAPPDVSASAAGPGLWFVPLAGGKSIHLGRLLPEDLIERPGEVTYHIAGTPTGIFAGARDVRARLTRGGAVADVRFTYPRDTSLDSLEAAFTDTLGAPRRRERRERRTEVYWLTSTTELELRRSDGEIWVFLNRPGFEWGVPPEHVRTIPNSGTDTLRPSSAPRHPDDRR